MALDKAPVEWTTIDGNVVPGSEAMVYSYTDGSAAWWEVWGWFPAMRFSRFFSVIE